jgi:hypothetical protein
MARGWKEMSGSPTSWWQLVVALALFIVVLDVLQATRGMAALLVFAGALAALGLAGWRWGSDSRDGADWRRTTPRR